MTNDFSMFAGDSKTLNVPLVSSAGEPVSINGGAWVWRLASGPTALTPLVAKSGSGNGSSILVALEPADTRDLLGNYYHELQVTDVSGNITTVLSGQATIKQSMIS